MPILLVRRTSAGSARAIVKAIEHFSQCSMSSCSIVVILPTWAVQAGRATTQLLDDSELLHKYLNACVHLAPSGVDDDAFILTFAKSTNALVVSNDLFRDHGA